MITVEPAPRKARRVLEVLLFVKPALRLRMAPPDRLFAMMLLLAPASMITALVRVIDLSPSKPPVALLAMVTDLPVLRAAP